MDLSADSGTLPTRTTVGGPVLEQELSLSSAHSKTEGGGTILLQLLEFKTFLLEAVEELHIRRDAETRFEDQISRLVLEKQELEWEKESLQHQTETVANQHTESLMTVKEQFQAKIRGIEEEKGKYQVSVELKDKEINNLKEELKSLQLLKYNLEKKSSELEQKLVLQSRSKDSHLNQLGEVEKRFSALSRQCTVVKQAHEKLEQNVDEAMKRNKKLTSANQKLEATIVSLKKELDEVSNKLIKAKMSSVRHEKNHNPTVRDQCTQQLQQKLNMETEMNKKLREENVAVRTEKQEVVRSLQQAQQLLLSQTQVVSRVELELQTQKEQYQALKHEHEVMREKSKAAGDKVVQLMESYAACRSSWDKEKEVFLDRIKSEQQGLKALNEAYDALHQKHTELSSQAKVQAQHIYELERKESSQSQNVSTQLFPTLIDEIIEEETPNEHVSIFEQPGSGSLQHLASTQTKKPDSLEDTGAVTQLVTTESTGGQDRPNQHQFKQPLNPSKLFTCHFTINNLCNLSGATGSDTKHINSSTSSESAQHVSSDLIHTTLSMSEDDLLISKGSCMSDTSTASVPGHMSVICVDLMGKELNNGRKTEKELGLNDDVKQMKNNREDEETREVQQWNIEVKREDVKEGGSLRETRGTLMAQTTDRADRPEVIQRSTEHSGDPKQPEKETKDRAEAEGTDGAEERGKARPHCPETQISAQTTTDTTTEKSDAQQVIDFMNTEPPLAASEPSDFSKSLTQTVSEKVDDSSHVNSNVSSCPNSVIDELQHICHDEVDTCIQAVRNQSSEKITEETPSDKSTVNIPTEVPEPLNLLSVCSSQTDTVSLAAQSDNIVTSRELETTATQTSNSSVITSNIKQTDEMCDIPVIQDCVSVATMVEPQTPQSQLTSEQACDQLWSLVTDDDDGDSSASKKRTDKANVDTSENNARETVMESVEKSDSESTCVDAPMDSVDLKPEGKTGSFQERIKNDKAEDAGDTNMSKTDVHLSPQENGASPKTSNTKCNEQHPAKKMLFKDTNESSQSRNKTCRSSFDWSCTQTKAGSRTFEHNRSGLGGLLGHPPITIPRLHQSKHNKVPLVITSASDLLNASSVCGPAASLRRHQQGERKAMGETSTADMVSYRSCKEESGVSLSISSFPVSTSAVSRQSWQNTTWCSRTPPSVSGQSSESDWELSCSQEREEQQSSFRAQISKVEQFLTAERLRLPKRRKTEI